MLAFLSIYYFFILTVLGCAAADVPSSMRNEFSTDFSRRSISYDKVISGGPQKDGIPAIDRPSFVSVEDNRLMDRGDRAGYCSPQGRERKNLSPADSDVPRNRQ